MSQENVDNARRAWDAYERGDLSAAIADLSADMVTYVAPPIPVSGTYHGPEGPLQPTLDWAEGFDELVVTAQEFFDAGDQVVVRTLPSLAAPRAAHRSNRHLVRLHIRGGQDRARGHIQRQGRSPRSRGAGE